MKALLVVLLALSLQGCQALLIVPAMAVQGAVLVGQAAVTAAAGVGVAVGAGVNAMAKAGEEDKRDEKEKEDKGIEPATTGSALPMQREAPVSDGPGSGQQPPLRAESSLQDSEGRTGTDAIASAAPMIDAPDVPQSTESPTRPAAPQRLAVLSTIPAPEPSNFLPIEVGGLHQGDRWEYAFVDSRQGREVTRKFEITGTEASAIEETIELGDGKTLRATHHGGAYMSLAGGLQFAPYYFAFENPTASGKLDGIRVVGGEACVDRGEYAYGAILTCDVRAEFAGTETVTVPAGTFEAKVVRVTVSQERLSGYGGRVGVLGTATYWFAPKAGRLVKAVVRHDAERPWTETMELVSTSHVAAQRADR